MSSTLSKDDEDELREEDEVAAAAAAEDDENCFKTESSSFDYKLAARRQSAPVTSALLASASSSENKARFLQKLFPKGHCLILNEFRGGGKIFSLLALITVANNFACNNNNKARDLEEASGVSDGLKVLDPELRRSLTRLTCGGDLDIGTEDLEEVNPKLIARDELEILRLKKQQKKRQQQQLEKNEDEDDEVGQNEVQQQQQDDEKIALS